MNKQYYAIGVTSILAVLFVSSLVTFWQESKIIADEIVAQDVVHLADILNQINRDCVIIDFEHQHNFIDFLNVIAFKGSEVGPMNLTYPENWHGPYLDDNPTVQEQYYQVVRTNSGHFVVPGPDVELSNGKIIGKDIVFEMDTDVQALIDSGQLTYEGKALAAPIEVGKL